MSMPTYLKELYQLLSHLDIAPISNACKSSHVYCIRKDSLERRVLIMGNENFPSRPPTHAVLFSYPDGWFRFEDGHPFDVGKVLPCIHSASSAEVDAMWDSFMKRCAFEYSADMKCVYD